VLKASPMSLPPIWRRDSMRATDALISANVILRGGLFEAAHYRDVATFMDLVNLIEASVLFDKLVCLPTEVPDGTEDLPLIKTLASEGILWRLDLLDDEIVSKSSVSMLDYCPEENAEFGRNIILASTRLEELAFGRVARWFTALNVESSCRKAYPHLGYDRSFHMDRTDMQYRFIRTLSYLSVASALKIPYIPNFNRLAIVNPILRSSVATIRKGFIEQASAAVSSSVRTQHEKLQLAGREMDIFVPPIASMVLDHARSGGNLGSAILKIRKDMAATRKYFARYLETIASDDVPLEESQAALERLDSDLKTILDVTRGGSSIRLLEWRPIAAFFADRVAHPEALKSAGSLAEMSVRLLEMPVRVMRAYFRRRRVQPILDIPQKVGRIKRMGKLTQDLFGWNVSPEEAAGLRRFLMAVGHTVDVTNIPESA